MAKQNYQKPKRAVFDPFGGIDTRFHHQGEPGASDIVNFRLTENGSLVKREGTHPVLDLSAPLRASWTGRIFGDQDMVILAGQDVILLQKDFTKRTLLGSIPTASTEAHFFFYRDRLYLLDGEMLYEIQENAIRPAEGYVPLLGKDWPTTYIGEIYEPRNLLSRHARIQYLVTDEPSIFLRTLYSVESVDALYYNDSLLDPSQYTYDDAVRCILMQGLKPGDRIHVCLTYKTLSEIPRESQSLPYSCSHVDIFGSTDNNRLFFWNGSNKNIFYPSTYIREEAMEASQAFVPDSRPLYIKEGSACVLGDGCYHVTGFVRQYNRILIFSETETFMADTDAISTDKFSAKPIHPHIGCAAEGACCSLNNVPFSVGTNGIYRFTNDTDDYNESNAISICEPIRSLLPAGFFRAAKVFPDRNRGELWFYAPSLEQSIWIYRQDGDAWYRFSGITISRLFEANGRLLFYNDRGFFLFDDDDRVDTDENGTTHEIVAQYHSNLLEYGTPALKHFQALTLRADCDGGSISVSLHGDGLDVLTCTFSGEDAHSILSRRLSSGRFRYATLSLCASGVAKPTVHSLISDVR